MLDWSKYIAVADRFQYKAKHQDIEDLNHTIILSLANAQKAKDNNGGGQLSDVAMLRVASYECQKYWRQQKRLLTILSLNTEIEDGDGNTTELWETLPDDKAIDIQAWVEDTTWYLGYPKRLVEIAIKLHNGENLTATDSQYLWRFRKRQQITLC